MLVENSLYTDQAGRDALVKDKVLVQDALCFSLFGFLGCYQLAQNRSFLKSYETSEGRLSLYAIGDTNHDVSLSIKLAADATTIPTPAAQNMTKLLYKIKAKQIKGPLDETLVRQLIAQLKLSAHRPSSMIYNAVQEFETGQASLGQLAFKLYNLSKIPNFTKVSGEFRQLVMKGQYQELFAKLPKIGSVGAAVTTTAGGPVTVKASPITAPVQVVSPAVVVAAAKPEFTIEGFANVPDDVLHPFLLDCLKSVASSAAVIRDAVIRFCKKNKIENKVDPVRIAISLLKATANWIEDAYNKEQLGSEMIKASKWVTSFEKNASSYKIMRLCWLHAYKINRPLLLEGRWKEFIDTTRWPYFYQTSLDEKWIIDDWNPIFLQKIIEPSLFWRGLSDTTNNSNSNMGSLFSEAVRQVYIASAMRTRKVTIPMLPLTPELWALLTWKISYLSSNYIAPAYYTGYENPLLENLLKMALHIPSENPPISVKKTGSTFVVGMSKAKVDALPVLKTSIEGLLKKGLIQFVDFSDLLTVAKDLTLQIASTYTYTYYSNFFNEVDMAFKKIDSASTVLSSEPYIKWFVESVIDNKIPLTIFSMSSYEYPDALKLYWNVAAEYGVDPRSKLSFSLWSKFGAFISNNPQLDQKDIQKMFNIHAGSFTPDDIKNGINGMDADMLNTCIPVLAQAYKDGTITHPLYLTTDDWGAVIKYTPVDLLGAWKIPTEKVTGFFQDYRVSRQKRNWFMLNDLAVRKDRFELFIKQSIKQISTGSSPILSLKSFITDYNASMIPESEIPDQVKAAVMAGVEAIKDLKSGVNYTDISGYNDAPIPPWLDVEIKKEILAAAHQTMNITNLANAHTLMDKKDFNLYVNSKTTQQFGDSIVIDDSTSAIQICKILTDMAKAPASYTINTLLRIAYAMHKNSKMIGKNASPDYTKSAYESICEILNSMSASGRQGEVDQMYDALSFAPTLRAKIVDWFRKASLLKNAIESVKNDPVHALVDIDQKRMNQLMRYNNIQFPAALTTRVTKANKLSDLILAHTTFDLEDLAITEETADEKQLDRRTAEYDAFNHYRHGGIGVKFLKTFAVNIQSQKAANAAWDVAHSSANVMDPVFHGTGSVAASFILRYGFSVIGKTDSSVVGRMLGDGIYFSNVLDKCGQYVGDGGYSRGIGTKGYVLQMKANLGTEGTDYKTAVAGVISPEWCVFHPNDQLNIYKAHFVELVGKAQIQAIKDKVALNENFFAVEQFREHLNEDVQNAPDRGCISYTFIDGQIPISDTVLIDFEQFDTTAYGPHVTMEPSALGPVIYISVADPDVSEVYAIVHTLEFMGMQPDFKRYLALLVGPTQS
jgi:hypothetical protein